ncbi:hypothetical protein AEAC466_16140 [Asticcacaulis sp. AC466]|uniref:hypothetical protein n=1 Tax=Asticcacaulis sp. AC466 TaxID=1282362 RepID=UPI0003C3D0CF|nr:hypothetical protein [Asticcacaulis sp. AC466]ESQ82669.1 hypothetical protein AEAC466_16140 [Asticcacaulis sp. AC466]
MSDSPDEPREPQAAPKRPQSQPQTPPKTQPKTQAERRTAQLQAALRENLRRRKVANGKAVNTPEPDHHEKAKQNDGEK